MKLPISNFKGFVSTPMIRDAPATWHALTTCRVTISFELSGLGIKIEDQISNKDTPYDEMTRMLYGNWEEITFILGSMYLQLVQ
jgi:hypothetical protein